MTEINETLLRSIIAEVMKEMSANTKETAAETSEKPVTKPVSNEKAVIRLSLIHIYTSNRCRSW